MPLFFICRSLGFIRYYDATKYLVLLGIERYDAIYDRIRYCLRLEIGITYVFSHYNAKIKIDSDDDLPLEEVLTLYSVIILIKSVFDKNRNHCYNNIFLE